MQSRIFTVIFWNIWYFAQDGRKDNGEGLIRRLSELIDQYSPDVFGLNEVLVRQADNVSPVIDFLISKGYYCHLAVISPTDDKWFVGNLLATRVEPTNIKEHLLGPDTQAARRGYTNCAVKAIEADLNFSGRKLHVFLTYLCSLLPTDWKTHIKHRRNYERAVNRIASKNLIIGGDFNETKYMLPWLRLPKGLKRRTGNLFNPTWRLNGQKKYLAFANYDNLIYNRTGNLILKEFKVLPRQPSDHSPLLGSFYVL